MAPLLVPLPGNEALAQRLAGTLPGELGRCAYHRFPDGESYVRFETPVRGRDVVLACTLHEPDVIMTPLLIASEGAREMGATSVGLVAPYLAYMRQDKRFQEGEVISAPIFARFLSAHVDWLVTVDPHLHRIARLEDVYTVPTRIAAAWPAIAAWLSNHVPQPLIIGPDEESRQWLEPLGKALDAPVIVLHKERRGDRDVTISLPEADRHAGRTPVLVDDIVSTAHTMIEAAKQCAHQGLPKPWCVGVHAVFAGDGYAALREAPIAGFVSCNTILHESNAIDLTEGIAAAVRDLGQTS